MRPLLSLVSRSHKAGRRFPLPKSKSRRLRLDPLEDRSVPAGFSFADFSTASGLSLVGDASITADHRLRLTPAVGGQEGGAWYTAEKQFVGLAFESTFQFQMTENADAPGGSDGLVFILQNHAPTYLAGGGGTLGYYRLPNSLAVEFDTFQNSEVNDPSGSHISVHTNGTGPNDWSESLSLGSYNTSPALLDDAAVHTVKIAYTPGSLAVYLDDLSTPKLTVAVDLAERLGLDAGRAWVGFTAATGGGWQNQDILNWTYNVAADTTTTVWVDDASIAEGNSGTSALSFTVTRSGDTTGSTTLNWATEDRTATAGSDYATASGQLVFGPGVTQQMVTVEVTGDATIEPHEAFVVRLSGAAGASVSDAVGIGNILSEDAVVSVGDASAIEGSTALKVLDRFVQEGSGGLQTANGSTFGPDGNGDGVEDLYVSSINSDAILRYDGVTGAFISSFVPSGSGGLDSPVSLAFSPSGHLFVSSTTTGKVFEYDSLGSFVGVPVSGLVLGTDRAFGLTFGPDGKLYIANTSADEVLCFDGSNLTVFVSAGSGGLDRPRNTAFGPDGNLYVASTDSRQVLRFNGQTGAFMNVFATNVLPGVGPAWLEFGTDGYLYTSSRNASTGLECSILRYNAVTGAFVDALDLARDGWAFSLGSDNVVYSSSNGAGSFVDRLGPSSWVAFEVTLGTPSAAPVTVTYSTADGSAQAGSDYTAASGTITFAAGQTSRAVLVQTINDSTGEPTETFTLNLSNPVGATIADGQGVATIVDNETKFFVVDDAASNLTYEYTSAGTSVESYPLNAGNTAPRGAASTAAGDKVWVVDANKKVYVYNPAGGLLGSWTPGSLPNNAVVEGIATNGTDVWIVDARGDKVYRYANAAGRLSGTQTGTGFNLAAGNNNPKGIVTDGNHLWVVNDAATDKVFRYTVGMAAAGNWAIDSANALPTGITLDPTNVGHLWIVDNGTDRVYQYDNAATRTGGSQLASGSFALAAGNTNPQDIADPPTGDMLVEPMPVRTPTLVTGQRPNVSSVPAWSESLLDNAFGESVTTRFPGTPADEPESEETSDAPRWIPAIHEPAELRPVTWTDSLAMGLVAIDGLFAETLTPE